MGRRGWVLAGVLVVVAGAGAFAFIALDEEPRETFCTTEGYASVPGPPGYRGPMLMAEDRHGSDDCDEPVDGSVSYAVVRGDDCAIAYPDDWPEESRTHTSVEPFGVDGTCWYAIDDDD